MSNVASVFDSLVREKKQTNSCRPVLVFSIPSSWYTWRERDADKEADDVANA